MNMNELMEERSEKIKKIMEEMNLTIDACPFCGGKAKFDESYFDLPAIICTECGAMVTDDVEDDEFYKVVEKWNRRIK